MSTLEQNTAEFADLLRGMTDEQFARFMQAVRRDLAGLYAPEELNPHKV